jgi:hypothetical protein
VGRRARRATSPIGTPRQLAAGGRAQARAGCSGTPIPTMTEHVAEAFVVEPDGYEAEVHALIGSESGLTKWGP